ncbi:hypothetical protein ACJMK2_028549 [Sinanodonta woodiana]|uniref:Uncharacterized protein n=1 Tax=Sinanodonta woodiana TaxID=1069815 RepID=A0ABD3X971_SINWO
MRLHYPYYLQDLQHKLAQEYYKDPERTTINSSNFPSELATPAVYPNHHLTPQENTTPAKESFDIPTSNSKRSSKSRNSLDSKTGIETGNEKKSQFLTSHLPDTGKKPERKKSKRKKKRAQQDAQGETINDPTIHPPPLYSSGYIRANIIIEGDFPIAVPENGRSHSLSLTKKEKRRKRLKACKGPPASGMLRYDDISSKRSNRNLDDKSESQKGGRHPLKSKVAPEMTQRQHNYNAINNAHHNRDAYKSADVEMNTIHYRDVDERHATGNIERQETDVKTSYGNHSFVHDRKVPQSTKRQRHHVEIWNVSDSNVHDIDFDGYRG